jgi:hypothetical protein
MLHCDKSAADQWICFGANSTLMFCLVIWQLVLCLNTQAQQAGEDKSPTLSPAAETVPQPSSGIDLPSEYEGGGATIKPDVSAKEATVTGLAMWFLMCLDLIIFGITFVDTCRLTLFNWPANRYTDLERQLHAGLLQYPYKDNPSFSSSVQSLRLLQSTVSHPQLIFGTL